MLLIKCANRFKILNGTHAHTEYCTMSSCLDDLTHDTKQGYSVSSLMTHNNNIIVTLRSENLVISLRFSHLD